MRFGFEVTMYVMNNKRLLIFKKGAIAPFLFAK